MFFNAKKGPADKNARKSAFFYNSLAVGTVSLRAGQRARDDQEKCCLGFGGEKVNRAKRGRGYSKLLRSNPVSSNCCTALAIESEDRRISR